MFRDDVPMGPVTCVDAPPERLATSLSGLSFARTSERLASRTGYTVGGQCQTGPVGTSARRSGRFRLADVPPPIGGSVTSPALSMTALYGGQEAVDKVEAVALELVTRDPGLSSRKLQTELIERTSAPFEIVAAALLQLFSSRRLLSIQGLVTTQPPAPNH